MITATELYSKEKLGLHERRPRAEFSWRESDAMAFLYAETDYTKDFRYIEHVGWGTRFEVYTSTRNGISISRTFKVDERDEAIQWLHGLMEKKRQGLQLDIVWKETVSGKD